MFEVEPLGGYTVITSLDWHAQTLAEKWLRAAVISPNLKRTAANKLLKRNDRKGYQIPNLGGTAA